MTETVSTESAIYAPSLEAAHEELLGRVVLALAADGAVTALVHREGDRPDLLQRIEQAREDGGALLLWRAADPALATEPVVVELLAEVAAGTPVVVELVESDSAPRRAPSRDLAADAALLAAALSATVLEARSADLALLTLAGESALVPDEVATIRSRLVVAGAAEDVLRSALSGGVAAAPVASARYVRALYEANLELRRANARLAREHLGRHDSAAATVLNRYEMDVKHQRGRFDDLQAAHDELLARHAELGRRMRMPHHRFVNALANAVLRIPGLGPLTRSIARRRAG